MPHDRVDQASPLHSDARLRQRLLGRLASAGTLVVGVAYTFTLLRAFVIGFRPTDAVQALIFLFVVGVFLARRRLGQQACAISLLLASLLWVVTAIAAYGLLTPSHIMVPFLTIFAGIVFGRRIALWLFGITTISLSIIGALHVFGVISYQVDVRVFAGSWTAWINLLLFEGMIALWYLFLFAPVNQAQQDLTARLSAVLQGLNDALFIHDKDSGAILEVNQKMCAMYGYSPDEATGLNVGALSSGTPPFDSEHARSLIEKTVSEGPQLFEWQAKDRSGRLFWVEVNMRMVDLDGAQRVLAVVRDIEARRRTEQDLARAKANLLALIDCSDEHIWSVDLEWRGLIANRKNREYVRRVFGTTTGVGVRTEDILPPERAKVWLRLYQRALTEGPFREEQVLADGSAHEIAMNPILEGDKKIGVAVFAKDITARKRAEEEQRQLQAQLHQAQKMEAIGVLAGGIAHDFNNILGGILGYADLALMELPQDSAVRPMLENILHGGARATELVRQILAFSRKTQIEKKPIQPHLVIKEVLKLLRSSLPTTISIKQQCTSTAWIMGDPVQVHQIMMNLCTNAGLAMRANGGVLEVSLDDIASEDVPPSRHARLMPGRYLRLRVGDTGCGIPPENLDHIFEPFFTTRAAGEGTGLGLSVVHGIVSGWGGSIHVESEVSRGTLFEVLLPICPECPEAAASRQTTCEGQERVLFVDDERDLTEIARQCLTRFGYQAHTFTDSKQALEAFRATPQAFDVLVTDMTMPGLTGAGLCAEVKRIRPDIPVILVTGSAENTRVAGFEGYLEKPVRPTSLAATIRQVCTAKP
jgi:PAS domain S-box-containing protein